MSSGSAWGPSAWKFLHTLTFAYPDNPTLEEQQSAESFFRSLGPLLPCASCREHYVNEIFSRPPEVSSKAALSSWLVEVHNRVNYRLGKPIISNFEAKRLYESVASQCSANCGGSSIARNHPSVAAKEKKEIKKDFGTAAAVSLFTLLILFALGSAFGFYVFKSWKKSSKTITNIKN